MFSTVFCLTMYVVPSGMSSSKMKHLPGVVSLLICDMRASGFAPFQGASASPYDPCNKNETTWDGDRSEVPGCDIQ